MGFLDVLGGVSGLAETGINALSGALNSKKQRKFALKQQNLQNEANMALAKYQNEFNVGFWNRQNEYNTPSAQIQRLKDAGLNPALAYNLSDTGNAGTPPNAVAPSIDFSGSGKAALFPKIEGLSGIMQNVLGLIQQMEDVKGKSLQNKILDIESRYSDSLFNYRSLKAMQDYQLRGGLYDDKDIDSLRQSIISRATGSADFIRSQIDANLSKINLNSANIGYVTSRKQFVDNLLYEYQNVEKPWTDSLGRMKTFMGTASSAISSLLNRLIFKIGK